MAIDDALAGGSRPALPGATSDAGRIFARSTDLVADVGDVQELNRVALQQAVQDVVTPELRI